MALSRDQGTAVWLSRWESWKVRARGIHKGIYEYPSPEKVDGKIRITCKDHGDFWQVPAKHLLGQGCSKCRGLGLDKLSELQRKYPEWDWAGTSVEKSKQRIILTCPVHGQFETTHNRLMNRREGLSPCPKCNHEAGGIKSRVGHEEWVNRIDGVWDGQIKLVEFGARCQDLIDAVCRDHGVFKSRLLDLVNGHGCPKCAPRSSRGESEIVEYLRSLGEEVEIRNRSVLSGYEIDIYLPKRRWGIEHCGMYWHGEKHKEAKYHQEKFLRAKSSGVSLITLFEDEWLFDSDKVKHQLLYKLGYAKQINGRDTRVVDLDWSEAKDFLEIWHRQGSGLAGRVRQGLTYKGDLVAVAVWGKSRFENLDNQLELYRLAFAGGYRIRGATSKLVKALHVPDGVTGLITYADLCWGYGASYEHAGFKFDGYTKPGYFWCKGLRRLSRHDFQKHKLREILSVYDDEKSEVENCIVNGYWRVFDCGNARWIKELK